MVPRVVAGLGPGRVDAVGGMPSGRVLDGGALEGPLPIGLGPPLIGPGGRGPGPGPGPGIETAGPGVLVSPGSGSLLIGAGGRGGAMIPGGVGRGGVGIGVNLISTVTGGSAMGGEDP